MAAGYHVDVQVIHYTSKGLFALPGSQGLPHCDYPPHTQCTSSSWVHRYRYSYGYSLLQVRYWYLAYAAYSSRRNYGYEYSSIILCSLVYRRVLVVVIVRPHL